MDKWLDEHALKDQNLGVSSTHVWADDGGMVVGYYTLLPTILREDADTDRGLLKILKPPKFWSKEAYGVLIGKIALDRSLRGKDLGIDLFGEAFFMANEAALLIGGLHLVIEPMDNSPKLRAMYEGYGFETMEGTDRMYVTFDAFRDGGVAIVDQTEDQEGS